MSDNVYNATSTEIIKGDISNSVSQKIRILAILIGFIILFQSVSGSAAGAAGAAAAAASSSRAAATQNEWYIQNQNLLSDAIDYCNEKGGELKRETYAPLNEVQCIANFELDIIKLNGNGSINSIKEIRTIKQNIDLSRVIMFLTFCIGLVLIVAFSIAKRRKIGEM